jgi:hypothetical protein
MRNEVLIATVGAMQRVNERTLRCVYGAVVPPFFTVFQERFAVLKTGMQCAIEAIGFVFGKLDAFTDGVIIAGAVRGNRDEVLP